jgi:hypothetical protein
MECDQRRRLQDEWIAGHDRLCLTLDEYERKLAALKQFDNQQVACTAARSACDQAKEVLEQHEREHGCLHESLFDVRQRGTNGTQ